MDVKMVCIELMTDAYGPKKISLDGGHDTIGYKLSRKDVNIDMQGTFYKELRTPGVYVLIGEREKTKGTGTLLYVGQSANVAERLYDHTGKRSGKEFWSECIAFVTASGIETSHAKILEEELYEELCSIGTFTFDNKRKPKDRSERAKTYEECVEIISDAKIITGCIGLQLFESSEIVDEYEGLETHIIEEPKKGIRAIGHYHATEPFPEGFMVHAGSEIALKNSKGASPSLVRRRNDLIRYNVIEDPEEVKKIGDNEKSTRFLNNRIFKSAGIAASVVLGRDASAGEWTEIESKKR